MGVGFRHGLCCASWAALRRARLAMASKATKRPLIEHFSALKDPRQIWKVVYPLPEIMLLVLCATLSRVAQPAPRMLPVLHRQRRGARGTPSVGLPAAICLAGA